MTAVYGRLRPTKIGTGESRRWMSDAGRSVMSGCGYLNGLMRDDTDRITEARSAEFSETTTVGCSVSTPSSRETNISQRMLEKTSSSYSSASMYRTSC